MILGEIRFHVHLLDTPFIERTDQLGVDRIANGRFDEEDRVITEHAEQGHEDNGAEDGNGLFLLSIPWLGNNPSPSIVQQMRSRNVLVTSVAVPSKTGTPKMWTSTSAISGTICRYGTGNVRSSAGHSRLPGRLSSGVVLG